MCRTTISSVQFICFKRGVLFFFYLILIVSSSCKKGKNHAINKRELSKVNSEIRYAKNIDIQHFNSFSILNIITPYPNANEGQKFVLARKNIKLPDSLNHLKKITIPLQKVIATSTTHIPMLEFIGKEKTLVGFPHTDYISSSKTRELINDGHIKNVGSELDFNTELILALQPDVIIGFSMGKNTQTYQKFIQNGIPVIYNSDWLEKSPLGRAEWVKLFGALYDQNNMTDSLFNTIEKEYLNTKVLAQKDKNTPTVLSGTVFQGKWHLAAGESFMAQLLQDAHTQYLWSDTKGQGSLVLSFESVFDKAKKAEYWIGAGRYTSFKDLQEANIHYSNFDAFKNNEVYTFSKKRGDTGGMLYFELGPLMPHIVLKDLVKITHPDLLPDHQPYFLEKLD